MVDIEGPRSHVPTWPLGTQPTESSQPTLAGTQPPVKSCSHRSGKKVPRQGDHTTALLTAAPPSVELRSEEHTSELQSRFDLVCRLLLEKLDYILFSEKTDRQV